MGKEAKTNAVRILERNGVPFTLLVYGSGEFTDGMEAARLLGKPPQAVFKTLVTVGDDKRNYVFVIPVAQELDLKKAAHSVGVKSVAMLHVKDIFAVTGYVRGGCTAIGMKKQFVTRVHESAASLSQMLVSAGRIGAQLELAPADYMAVTGAAYADLVRD